MTYSNRRSPGKFLLAWGWRKQGIGFSTSVELTVSNLLETTVIVFMLDVHLLAVQQLFLLPLMEAEGRSAMKGTALKRFPASNTAKETINARGQ